MINESTEVESLAAEGKHKEAAQVAKQLGLHARAADLYAGIWDFDEAAQCAEMDGDLPRALSWALEAKNRELAAEYAEALQAQGKEGKEQTLAIFTKRRHFAKAARLAEELELPDDAISLYQQGHLDMDAARLMIAHQQEREAGRLLEKVVKNLDPGEQRSEANLQLGLLLAAMMQHEQAVRCLQDAVTSDKTRSVAQEALVLELGHLGLRDAARSILLDLRKRDSSVSPNLDAYLRAHRKKPKKRNKDKQLRIVGGRYRLEDLLGSGASGRVYSALDQVSGKRVAVKLLSSSHASGSDAYARFAREAKLATTLHHPNLVETYAVSPQQGFLVMELMAGKSLEEKSKTKMAPPVIRRMCLDVLAGLQLAHQRGIIHRDIKPANIFFDARGTAKIGDFGVAHLLDMGQTQTGGLIGTLAYMSPEQITGAPLTIAADLYGVGVTIYEVLCGRLPFQGPDFVAQHLGEQAPTPSEVSDCDPVWDPILLRLLEKNPGDRYDSIDVLRRELTAIDFSDEVTSFVLPRAKPVSKVEPQPQSETPSDENSSEDKVEETSRYTFSTPIGTTPSSTLSRAIDTMLNRSVIIEQFNAALDSETERRLFALARGGGPFLQRALSYDKSQGIAIFEAPTGSPMSELSTPMSTRLATRLFKRLARALAPLHASDRYHGGISGTTVLLDGRGHPTVLVSGLQSAGGLSIQSDTEQIMMVVSEAVGMEPDEQQSIAETLVLGLLGPVNAELSEPLLAMPTSDGEELYAFAEAIELILLKQKQQRL